MECGQPAQEDLTDANKQELGKLREMHEQEDTVITDAKGRAQYRAEAMKPLLEKVGNVSAYTGAEPVSVCWMAHCR
jgi:hypothetical protein